jgi:hypothetical protein
LKIALISLMLFGVVVAAANMIFYGGGGEILVRLSRSLFNHEIGSRHSAFV